MGPDWWKNNIEYYVIVYVSDQEDPYGNRNLEGNGRPEILEGMAESIEHYMADLQYGLQHSNPGNLVENRYSNMGEELDFWRIPNDENEVVRPFIPEGLFFDLFDVNQVFPEGLTIEERDFVTDNCGRVSFEAQMNALTLGPVDLEEYRNALIQTGAVDGDCTLNQLNQLFLSYDQ